MKSKWITHKGKKILFADYSNFEHDSESLFAEVEAVDAIVIRQPEKSVRMLLDTRNSVASKEVIAYFKNAAAKTQKYMDRMAIIGISGIRKILFDAVTRFSGQKASLFDDMEKAKDWLAE
jgi:hypothetical protein